MIATPRIYLDSSVIAASCDPKYKRWVKSLLGDFRKGIYKPVISELVQAEVADAPMEVKAAYDDLMQSDPRILAYTEKADTLAELYLDRKVLKEQFFFEALHMALATLAEVDVFCSLDHPHILHFAQVRGFTTVNIEMGLKPIQIRCPRLMASHDRESY